MSKTGLLLLALLLVSIISCADRYMNLFSTIFGSPNSRDSAEQSDAESGKIQCIHYSTIYVDLS